MILFSILCCAFISFFKEKRNVAIRIGNTERCKTHLVSYIFRDKAWAPMEGIDARYNQTDEFSNTFLENMEKLALYEFLKNDKISQIEKRRAIEEYENKNQSKYVCDIFAGILYDW